MNDDQNYLDDRTTQIERADPLAAQSTPNQARSRKMMTKSAKIDELILDVNNANKGTQRGLRALDSSLRKHGCGRSILLDRKNRVIAGNKTTERAADIGIDDVILVETDGTKLVAVKRTDLDLEEDGGKARALATYDNRVGQLDLDWDVEQLGDLDAELLNGLWTDTELDKLGLSLGDEMRLGEGKLVYSDEQIADAAFAYYRSAGFPYRELPPHVSMQEINKLAQTEFGKLIHTTTASKVADTYHPHRYHAFANGMKSPFEAFMSDKDLRKAIEAELKYKHTLGVGYFGSLNLVNGTQACSNFRPGFAAYLYRKYCPQRAVVLDASTGYGGRMIGAIASGVVDLYIGIDPNRPTHYGNMRMAKELGFIDKIELHNLPAEDVPHEKVAGRCDFAFTSPPYFAKEIYCDDENQSWVRYKTGDAWRFGFLRKMFDLQYAALKPGCYSIVNIANVKIGNQKYPLEFWAVEEGKAAGFEYIKTDRFELSCRWGAYMPEEVAYEPIIIFRKVSDDRKRKN